MSSCSAIKRSHGVYCWGEAGAAIVCLCQGHGTWDKPMEQARALGKGLTILDCFKKNLTTLM